MKKKMFMCLFVCFVATGCVWKSEHLKKMELMGNQLTGASKQSRKLKEKLEKWKQLAQKTFAEKKALEESKNTLQATLSHLRDEVKSLKGSRERCLESLKNLANSKGEMGDKLKKSMEQLEHFKKLAEKRKALFEKLKNSFRSMVASGKLRIVMKKGMLILQLAEKILFDSGSAKVKSEGKKAIAQVTQLLIKTKRRWQVLGHTDNVGSSNYNWKLSARRGLGVLFVMLKNGMKPNMISVAGFGQYYPTAGNDTDEDKAKNRRTEIALVPDLEELQKYASVSSPTTCLASK